MRYGRELPQYPFNVKAFLTRCLIVAQWKIYGKGWFPWSDFKRSTLDWDAETTQVRIAETISAGKPAMIARFGSHELEATLRGLAIHERAEHGWLQSCFRLLIGRSSPFWWDNSIRGGLCWNAGFFPPDNVSMELFSRRFIADCRELDIMASTWPGEERLRRRFFPKSKCCGLWPLSAPFRLKSPWTGALQGKRVLVVYPCAKTIQAQYAKRELLFQNPDVLPIFNLATYTPCSSFGGNYRKSGFGTWFNALDRMIDDIAALDFDIAIIGAGAYGFCLAAAVKRMGRIGIQLGGTTQLLFGIKGKRWEDTDISRKYYNEHWVRPSADEVPENAKTIEGGCYW